MTGIRLLMAFTVANGVFLTLELAMNVLGALFG